MDRRQNKYELSTILTSKELTTITTITDEFHGDWNYVIHSQKLQVILCDFLHFALRSKWY